MTDISVIIPVYNGEKWINNCMNSIASQSILSTDVKLEIVVYNDGSKDKTVSILEIWKEYFNKESVNFIINGGETSKGVGAAKNCAVKSSTGQFLCFQDIDDVMHPDRILLQWEEAQNRNNAIIGSRISRVPENSTPRLVRWANNLKPLQLKLQVYTANGPTILMPTWFCHRSVYNKVGGFDESGYGTPEDLIFFYAHLDAGGEVYRVDKELLIYTYHEGAATFTIAREMIWQVQLDRLQKHVLSQWKSFTVWNAGKAGRRFVRALSSDCQKKIFAFCDVDKNKIGTMIQLYNPDKREVGLKLPVVHFKHAKPPLVICVKLDLTNGEFESNLNSMNLTEGKDYILFN